MIKRVLLSFGIVVFIVVVFTWQTATDPKRSVVSVITGIGSVVSKARVRVSDVTIDLQNSKAIIGKLTIANPAGYSVANILELKNIEIELDLGFMQDNLLVIKSIRIKSPKISYEGHGPSKTNMEALLNNIDGAEIETGVAEHGAAFRVIVDRLEFGEGLVKISSLAKPGDFTEITLPKIELSGLALSQDGVKVEVAVRQVARSLVGAIISEATDTGVYSIIAKKRKTWIDVIRKELKKSN